jgi:hypothetical protein
MLAPGFTPDRIDKVRRRVCVAVLGNARLPPE